jgi:hypothetical protein
MPPDTIQVTGDLSYYWGPNGGVFLRELGHVLGHLEYPQGHDLLTTLELPAYGIALSSIELCGEAVDSLSMWACESG